MFIETSSSQLFSTCTMRLIDFEKGQKDLEPRDCLRLFLFQSGNSECVGHAEDLSLNGTLKPGSIMVVPAGATINYEMSARGKGMVVGIDQRQLSAVSSLYGIPDHCSASIKPMLMRDSLVHSIMDNMANSMVETPRIARTTHAASLPLMLLAIMRASQSGTRMPSAEPIERVLDFIAGNLERDLSLDALAEVAGLSKWHFTRRFAAQVGMSPRAFVADCRIKKAKTLLTRSHSALSEIAYECGFSSQSHMTTVFASEVGTTPGRYRAMARN